MKRIFLKEVVFGRICITFMANRGRRAKETQRNLFVFKVQLVSKILEGLAIFKEGPFDDTQEKGEGTDDKYDEVELEENDLKMWVYSCQF